MKEIIPKCSSEYSIFTQDIQSYGVEWKTLNFSSSSNMSNIINAFKYTKSNELDSYVYTGQINTYDGGGYVFRMQGDRESIYNQTQTLQNLNWIDAQTAAIFVEFTLFNPQIALFQHCLILIEITSVGDIFTSSLFTPINLFDLNNPSLISFEIILYLFYLTLVCFLIVNEVRSILKIKWSYFKIAYNYFDLAIIGFSWSAFSFFLYRMYGANVISDKLSQSKNICQLENAFINFQYMASCQWMFDYLMGACVFFSSLRFIKVNFQIFYILFEIHFSTNILN